MTAVIEANDLGKRYGRKRALAECTLAIPAGKVVGLVGPNGAGKTTLLHLRVGLLQPSAGSISVLGGRPGTTPTQLARVGFVAQDTPTRAGFSIEDHLRFGIRGNARVVNDGTFCAPVPAIRRAATILLGFLTFLTRALVQYFSVDHALTS